MLMTEMFFQIYSNMFVNNSLPMISLMQNKRNEEVYI